MTFRGSWMEPCAQCDAVCSNSHFLGIVFQDSCHLDTGAVLIASEVVLPGPHAVLLPRLAQEKRDWASACEDHVSQAHSRRALPVSLPSQPPPHHCCCWVFFTLFPFPSSHLSLSLCLCLLASLSLSLLSFCGVPSRMYGDQGRHLGWTSE